MMPPILAALPAGYELIIAAALLAFLWRTIQRLPTLAAAWAERTLIVRAEITDDDEAYRWVARWLGHTGYGGRSRRVTVFTTHEQEGAPTIHVVPAPGIHIMRWRGYVVWIQRNRREPNMVSSSETSGEGVSRAHFESFAVRILTRRRAVLDRFLGELRDLSHPHDEDTLVVFSSQKWGADWSAPRRRLPRPPDSVQLPGDLMDKLIADAQRFFDSRDWYVGQGIPWHRGYLLHGPPGTGKTSTALALASCLSAPLYVLSLKGKEDSDVLSMLMRVPERALVLIEDVDTVRAAQERVEGKADEEKGVSAAGLYNAVDGALSPEGVIFIFTTNHRDRLDPALLRPGRVDRDVYLGHVTVAQGLAMLERFFPEEVRLEYEDEEYLTAIIETAERKGQPYTPAQVQEMLMRQWALREQQSDLGSAGRVGAARHQANGHRQEPGEDLRRRSHELA